MSLSALPCTGARGWCWQPPACSARHKHNGEVGGGCKRTWCQRRQQEMVTSEGQQRMVTSRGGGCKRRGLCSSAGGGCRPLQQAAVLNPLRGPPPGCAPVTGTSSQVGNIPREGKGVGEGVTGRCGSKVNRCQQRSCLMPPALRVAAHGAAARHPLAPCSAEYILGLACTGRTPCSTHACLPPCCSTRRP